MLFSVCNPLSPLDVNYTCTGVEASARAWVAFQGQNPRRKSTLLSPSAPPHPTLEFWLVWSCVGLVVAVTVSMGSVATVSCFSTEANCLQFWQSAHTCLPWWPLNLGERGCNTAVLFRSQHSTVLSFALWPLILWQVSLLTASTEGKGLSNKDWKMHYSLDIKVKAGIREMVPQLSIYIAFPEDTSLFYSTHVRG